MNAPKKTEANVIPGPFDVVAWPEQLTARVVEGGSDPAIHGYSVRSDLSVHYGFTATIYLALTGELPEPDVARALDVILTVLSPVAINEAPSHAAAIAHLCGAPTRSVIGTAAIGLAERAGALLERQAEFLAWLRDPKGEPPACARSSSGEAEQHRRELRAALPASFSCPALDLPLNQEASCIAALFACGLTRADQMEAAWALSGLAASVAEGLALPRLGFLEYPMNLPAFRYQETP